MAEIVLRYIRDVKLNNKIRSNFLYNLFYQVFAIIVPIITMPYISRVLGPQGIGEYSYTYSNMSYFLLFAASGTASFAQREIVRFRSEVNKRNDVFWNIVAFRTISTVVLFLLYIGLVFCILQDVYLHPNTSTGICKNRRSYNCYLPV